LKNSDYIWIGVIGAGAIVAYNLSKNLGQGLFGGGGGGGGTMLSNIFNPSLNPQQQIDWSEQQNANPSRVDVKDVLPDEVFEKSGWDKSGFIYQEKQQSFLTPTNTNLRALDNEGNLSSYNFNPNDLSAAQRRGFNAGFYDFENDTLQFGLFQGAERKLRQWFTGKEYGSSPNVIQNYTQNYSNSSAPAPTKAEQITQTKEQIVSRVVANESTSSGSKGINRLSSSAKTEIYNQAAAFEKATTKEDKIKALRAASIAAGATG